MGDILLKIGFDFKFFIFNLINFVLVAVILYMFFFKKVFKTIEERQKLIAQGLEDKEKYSVLLTEAQKQSEEIIANAKKNANQITEEQKSQALALASKILSEAHNQSDIIIKGAKIAAEKEKLRILDEVKKDSVHIVVQAAKKLSEDAEINNANNAREKVKQIIVNNEVIE